MFPCSVVISSWIREIFVKYCTRMNKILYDRVLEETVYSAEVFIVHFYPTVVNMRKIDVYEKLEQIVAKYLLFQIEETKIFRVLLLSLR